MRMTVLAFLAAAGLGLGAPAAAGAQTAATAPAAPAPAAPAPPAATVTAETTRVAFVLVNDIDQMGAVKGRGGFPKFATVLAAERARKDQVTIAVHAGDTLSPCLLCGLDQGAHVVDIVNAIGFDVFVPGNHEFDFGKDVFLRRMAELKAPILAANVKLPGGGAVANVAPTRMIEAGPLKIGVVGVVTEETRVSSSPGDLVVDPAVETATAAAKTLRAAGADLVVAVAHVGREDDARLMASRAFDVVLSGHDHDLRVVYDGRTVLAESSSQGEFVTVVRLDVEARTDAGRRVVSFRPTFDIVDSIAVKADPAIAARVTATEATLETELAVEIGRTSTPLDSRRATVRTEEAAIGNLITDAIRASTGADVALMNGGGIRANKEYPAGSPLTRRDVLSELPFGNRTVMVRLSGADLHAALENGVSQLAEAGGRFPQVSGLTMVVERSATNGIRVVEVKVGGKPLDPAATYTVAANEFMLRGGDGYAALGRGKVLIGAVDGKLLANEVMSYVRARGTVEPKVEGRIVIR